MPPVHTSTSRLPTFSGGASSSPDFLAIRNVIQSLETRLAALAAPTREEFERQRTQQINGRSVRRPFFDRQAFQTALNRYRSSQAQLKAQIATKKRELERMERESEKPAAEQSEASKRAPEALNSILRPSVDERVGGSEHPPWLVATTRASSNTTRALAPDGEPRGEDIEDSEVLATHWDEEPETAHQEGFKSFLEGAVVGSFSDNESWSAIAGQTAVGFIPIVGQIADARDIVAAGKDVLEGEEGAWADLIGALRDTVDLPVRTQGDGTAIDHLQEVKQARNSLASFCKRTADEIELIRDTDPEARPIGELSKRYNEPVKLMVAQIDRLLCIEPDRKPRSWR